MRPPTLHPALLGGLFIGVVSALPILRAVNSCCCLWLGVGGVLAAYVMQQNHPRPVSLGNGAAVGFLAGVSGFFIMLAVAGVVALIGGPDAPDFSQGMLAPPQGMNPEVRDLIRSIPPAAFAVLGGLLFLGVGSIVSTVGGIVGAALFRRRDPAGPAGAPVAAEVTALDPDRPSSPPPASSPDDPGSAGPGSSEPLS